MRNWLLCLCQKLAATIGWIFFSFVFVFFFFFCDYAENIWAKGAMLWLREAYSPKFNFEQFPGISNIPNWNINYGQPLWLSIFNLNHCGRPRWAFILAIVWNYIIFELSTMPNFQIVPWLKGNCFSMMFSSGMIVGYRIWAMVSHILTCFCGHHLQETNLVGIGFVGKGKSTVGGDVWKPSFSLFSHVRYLQKELIFMKLAKIGFKFF